MEIIRHIPQLRERLQQIHTGTDQLGLVPTMGALHDGHATLVRQARSDNDLVAVSIFPNPLQFENLGDCDDYRNYPRQLDADATLLEKEGVDLIFAPSEEEMYPSGVPQLWVRTGAIGQRLEGASRPGHFDGVATVVSKLFHLIAPNRAYFGQKDAQQLAIIKAMVHDLNFPVEICPVPIIRAADGLAESSRNQRLSVEEREQALVLSRTLFELRERAARGERLELDAARQHLDNSPGVRLDHLEVVDALTLEPLEDGDLTHPALAVAAIHVGPVRLIDNMELHPGA